MAYDGALASKPAISKAVAVVNTPPPSPKISLSPQKPTTDEELVCRLDIPSEDADLDPVTYSYQWKVNRKSYPKATTNRIAKSATKRGQKWTCSVTPHDGEAKGKAVSARVEIGNSEPTRPVVGIKPRTSKPGDTLKCEILTPSEDSDRDRVRYSYVWLKDGVQQSFAPTSVEVPGRLVKSRDLWRCRVTPNDGITDGKTAESPDVLVSR